MAFTRADDKVIALQEAVSLFGDRYDLIAAVDGDAAAAMRVTAVADVFVAWLRELASIELELVAIEEIETGEVVTTSGGSVTTLDSSQRARYVISAADDRGFPVDATLSATSSDEAVVTVEILEASTGTASGKDELVATFAGVGSALVTVFDPANPDTIFGSDNIDAVAGGVAAVVLETPTIEEVPTP